MCVKDGTDVYFYVNLNNMVPTNPTHVLFLVLPCKVTQEWNQQKAWAELPRSFQLFCFSSSTDLSTLMKLYLWGDPKKPEIYL